MMFTDNDLKRLKEDVGNGLWLQKLSGSHLSALIARLEAAEKVIHSLCDEYGCIDISTGIVDQVEAWRKAAGK